MPQQKKQKTSPIAVEKYLKGMEYPASKDELIEHAEDSEAPDEVVDLLNKLPDETYDNAADVTKAMGTVQ